jgi:lysophospholipase L1-like esterase
MEFESNSMNKSQILAFLLVLIGATPITAQTRVAAIGDSITFGAGIPSPAINGYPAQLQAILGGGFDVQNFGRSGADVLQINNGPYINTTEHQNALAFNPEVVISNLGINDFAIFLDNQQAFVDDYVDLLDDYAALPTNPTIYLWTQLAPVFAPNPNAGVIDAQRGQVNLRLAEIASTLGAIGINMYDPLKDHSELFPDGLHPDADGAGIIAQTTADFAFGALPNGVAGDVNQDGVVTTGSGNPVDDDVAQFLLGWRSDTSALSQLDRTLLGDLNVDGVTSLADVFILHEILEAQGQAFPFEALHSVPEPRALALLFSTGLTALVWSRRRRPGKPTRPVRR